jgi:AraC-like DNA-binding protein
VSLLTATLDLVKQFGPDLDPLVPRAVSQHLVDLSALVLDARGDSAELVRGRGLAAAQLMVIQRYMVDQLSEPKLSVREVAARHNVSVRYVQQLFERSGTTFTRFLLEQRLLAAYGRLTNVLARAVSITQIASECGFGDLSTFNRAFRRRFGASDKQHKIFPPMFLVNVRNWPVATVGTVKDDVSFRRKSGPIFGADFSTWRQWRSSPSTYPHRPLGEVTFPAGAGGYRGYRSCSDTFPAAGMST